MIDCDHRHREIEDDYKSRLAQIVEELDNAKAQNLASLERDLLLRQSNLIENARDTIDQIEEDARQSRLGLIQQADLYERKTVNDLTDTMAKMGQESSTKKFDSTTTTVITTDTSTITAKAPSTQPRAAVTTTTVQTIETNKGQSTTTAKSDKVYLEEKKMPPTSNVSFHLSK